MPHTDIPTPLSQSLMVYLNSLEIRGEVSFCFSDVDKLVSGIRSTKSVKVLNNIIKYKTRNLIFTDIIYTTCLAVNDATVSMTN